MKVIRQDHGSERSIFKESQKSEIKDNIKNKYELCSVFVLIESKTGEIIDDYRSKHQKNVNRLPPGIEEQTGKKQKDVNVFIFAKYSASDKNHGQKYHDKEQRTKKHISP